MNEARELDEGRDAREIEDLLRKLSGRVLNEIWVIDGRTSEKRLLCTYDFDIRDTVQVVFMGAGVSNEDSSGAPGKEIYTFCLQKPGEEVDTEMAAKKRTLSQQDLADFGEALTKSAPTCEDYLHNVDIQFEDLSTMEKCRVLEHDLDNLLDMFDSFGYSEEEKKPGLFGKIFSKKKTAA